MWLALTLMIGIPLVGLLVILTAFAVAGRFVRRARRAGRISYPARTTPGSNDFTSNGM